MLTNLVSLIIGLLLLLLISSCDSEPTSIAVGDYNIINASKDGKIEIVKELIKMGSDINELNQNGENALMCANQSYNVNQYEIMKLLIENGIDVNHKDNDGYTMIMKLCMTNNINIIKLLIENGADLNAVNRFGATALTYALENKCYGRVNLIKLLADNGAIGKDSTGCAIYDTSDTKEGYCRLFLYNIVFSYNVDIIKNNIRYKNVKMSYSLLPEKNDNEMKTVTALTIVSQMNDQPEGFWDTYRQYGSPKWNLPFTKHMATVK